MHINYAVWKNYLMNKLWIIEHFDSKNGLQYLAEELKLQGKNIFFIDATKGQELDLRKYIPYESIFFGSQELGEKLKGKLKYLFLGNENFLISKYNSFPKILNTKCQFMKLSDVLKQIDSLWKKYPNGFFIRPNSWLKSFSGQVLTQDSFKKSWDRINFYITEDIDVCISELKTISNEYRLLCIDGELITASLYKKDYKDNYQEVEVELFKNLFQEIIQYNILPDLTCTIDIAESNGTFSLIEFNPLSTSAIYRCNPILIINKFTDY